MNLLKLLNLNNKYKKKVKKKTKPFYPLELGFILNEGTIQNV